MGRNVDIFFLHFSNIDARVAFAATNVGECPLVPRNDVLVDRVALLTDVGRDEGAEARNVLAGDDAFSVLLFKVVAVLLEDLDKEVDGDGSVHDAIGDLEGPLEALEDALAVAVAGRLADGGAALGGGGSLLVGGQVAPKEVADGGDRQGLVLYSRSSPREP